VSVRIQQRVMEIMRVELSAKKISRLQIRICQHYALEGIESREGTFMVT
jgi:hypothetical protein